MKNSNWLMYAAPRAPKMRGGCRESNRDRADPAELDCEVSPIANPMQPNAGVHAVDVGRVERHCYSMRIILSVGIMVLLATTGCRPQPSSQDLLRPSGYLHFVDRFRAVAYNYGILAVQLPCEVRTKEGSIASKPTDECERTTPPRRWRGLWRYQFEAPQFCEAPARECPSNPPGIYVEAVFQMLPGFSETPPGGLYQVEFIGRRTLVPQPYVGRMREHMIVDQVISIKELEPPTMGPMTDELAEAYRKECSGVPICMPNSLVTKTK